MGEILMILMGVYLLGLVAAALWLADKHPDVYLRSVLAWPLMLMGLVGFRAWDRFESTPEPLPCPVCGETGRCDAGLHG